MKAIMLLALVFIFTSGHSYAEDAKDVLEAQGVQSAPAAEVLVITQYEKVMNGVSPVDVKNPTDVYGKVANDAKVMDYRRVPGKVIGRSPAVIDNELLNDKKLGTSGQQK